MTAPWRVVALAMLLIGWGGNQFTPLLLAYRAHNGFSQVDVDVLLGAYVVGLVPGLLLSAALSDRWGRRPLLLAGLGSSILGSLVLALGDRTGFGTIFAGRVLSGLAIGTAMAVGTAWVVELSESPERGARRAAISLSIGLGLGPGVAVVLAQWTRPALVWPYVVQAALCAPVLIALLRWGVETRRGRGGPVRLRVPAVAHRRFLHVVLPMAPWIFGTASIAYAIVPQLVGPALGRWALLYSGGLTVATLGCGVLIQPIARRLDDRSTARAVVVSMVITTLGVGLAVVVAVTGSPLLGLLVSVLLGAAYGIAVVSGLLEVQRIASPTDRAGLTGVYYSLAYVGFLLPAALAAVHRSYPMMLGGVAVVALLCTLACASGWSRHLTPGSPAGSAALHPRPDRAPAA